MDTRIVGFCFFAISALFPMVCRAETNPEASLSSEQHTLVGERNFLTGYEPMNSDGTINVVIEIPTGTTASWGWAA